jgi:hypothetical protein
VLVTAFGLVVRASAGGKRTLRIAGGLWLAYGLLGLTRPFAAMHQRQVWPQADYPKMGREAKQKIIDPSEGTSAAPEALGKAGMRRSRVFPLH